MRRLIVAVAILVLLGAAAFWFLTEPATVSADALPPHTPDLANGEVMFHAGGCASCHAVPKQEDQTRLGGGLALKTRFGTFYPPNISPDPADGIGRWSEADFVTAMWKGTSPAREHYYPAFPYTSFQRMKMDDVRDLFAYLKRLPPVQGRPPAHDIPYPFAFRRVLGLWKLLYLDGKQFEPDPTRPADWNRGAYLVNGPGHCAECHSPRNALGAIIPSKRFSGGPDPEGGEGKVPNITPAGIGSFSVGDIAEVLASGITPDGDTVGGSMVEVVRNTSKLSAEDRNAMAVYLKSLPPVESSD